MSARAFLDSGIFIALLSKKDRWHGQATALFDGTPRPRWSTSLFVVSETYSWCLHRMGEEPARAFRQLLASLQHLEIFEASLTHHIEVTRMLDRLRGAKLTYVDASSLVLIERHRIRQVWSTDHHLGLTGAEVRPRS